MIHQLKKVFRPYVRSEADIEAWIDQGKPFVRGKSLFTEEEFVVNLKQITTDAHIVIAIAGLWYAEHAGTISDDEQENGMTYDVSVINEDEYELQFVFNIKRRFIISKEGDSLNVHECTG